MKEEHPQLISSVRVFEGRVFCVRVDRVAYNDGVGHRLDVVEHGGSYAIVATTAEDKVVLVRQHRHAIGRSVWEIPAGTAEAGEDPGAGAARELREETGYRAARMHPIGAMYMTPGFCDEALHFFHAQGLEPGEQDLDDDERITVSVFTLEEAAKLVLAGEIADAKTIVALQWLGGSRGQLAALTVDI